MHILPSKKYGRTNERAKTKNKLQGFGTTKICVWQASPMPIPSLQCRKYDYDVTWMEIITTFHFR